MPVRARDLRSNIAEMGFEKGMVHTLELALEELSALRGNMRDAADLIHGLMGQMDQFLRISSGMEAKLKQLQKETSDDEPQGQLPYGNSR